MCSHTFGSMISSSSSGGAAAAYEERNKIELCDHVMNLNATRESVTSYLQYSRLPEV
jgi:hypothetical protein